MNKVLNVTASVLVTILGTIPVIGICYAIVQLVTGNVVNTAHFEF
jgi:hypothetical protein